MCSLQQPQSACVQGCQYCDVFLSMCVCARGTLSGSITMVVSLSVSRSVSLSVLLPGSLFVGVCLRTSLSNLQYVLQCVCVCARLCLSVSLMCQRARAYHSVSLGICPLVCVLCHY